MTLDPYLPQFARAVEHLQRELQQIRTGRATPALVEDVPVEAYGATMRVKELATITCPDARTIQIDPWDKGVVKDIERAIRTSQPMLNPVVTGTTLRVPMPHLTEESRRELAKTIAVEVEEAKHMVRRTRDEARKAIVESERVKEIAEDDKFRLQKKLDELTEECTSKLKVLGDQKSQEIMTV